MRRKILAQRTETRKEVRGIQFRKEALKLSLFEDDIIICVHNSKDSTTTTKTKS